MENERIIEILKRMEKDQRDFFAKMEAMWSSMSPVQDKLIDSLEVQKLLNRTRRTVYRLTKKEILKAKPIGGRNYYSLNAILEIKDQYCK